MLEILLERQNDLTKMLDQSLLAHKDLIERIDETKQQSLANHNALLGRKFEIDELIKKLNDNISGDEPINIVAEVMRPLDSVDHEEQD